VLALVTNKQFCAFGITFDDVSNEASQRVLAPQWRSAKGNPTAQEAMRKTGEVAFRAVGSGPVALKWKPTKAKAIAFAK
jgi:hypothetical protein